MPDAPPAHPAAAPAEAAPHVEGTIGNAGIGIGYAIGKLAGALSGDGGIRVLALSVVACFGWVTTWAVTQMFESKSQTDALLVRTGEDRVEREKADNARREKELRDWMASEMEKQRQNFSANVSFLTKSMEGENERNRAMVFKLAGAKIDFIPGPVVATPIPKIEPDSRP